MTATTRAAVLASYGLFMFMFVMGLLVVNDAIAIGLRALAAIVATVGGAGCLALAIIEYREPRED